MKRSTRCVTSPEVNLDGFDSFAVPVYRASTIPFPDAKSYESRHQRGDKGYSYGLTGTPTTRALEEKISVLHGGLRTFLVPSGQAAVAFSILPFVRSGDSVLLPDSAYPPVRDLAREELHHFGVKATFYDPTSLDSLVDAWDERVRVVWIESPGSTTMEVQDVAAIAAIAHERGAIVGCDNTWATPLNFRPLEHGADIAVEALTKYFSGHSDVLMGSITVNRPDHAAHIKASLGRIGIGASPDDASLVLRGIETMAVRLRYSAGVAERLAGWLAAHPLVEHVLFPALPGSPGHEIWSRDFEGSGGVFTVVFTSRAVPHIYPALDALSLVRIGASWGGTRSLVAPMPVKRHRTARPWEGDDLLLRISIGLEDESDLRADLAGFLADLERRTGAGPSNQ